MPDKAKFWNRIAKKYAARPVTDEASYRRKLEDTQARLRSDMRIVEFGCGTGTTALAHAPHVAHVLATDISPTMLDIARDKAAAEGAANVEFRQADIDTFETEDRFDAVLCLSLLHLLEDRRAAIAKAHDLLKPGGLFVASTACLADMSPALRLIAPLMRWWFGIAHLKAFSGADLLADLRAAGFEIELEWRPKPSAALFTIARKPA